MRGIDSAYVSYHPDLAAPGAVATVGSFAELAVANGVPRLVLLSGRGEPEAELAEQAVRDAGADWTILRSTWFSQNFSEDYMLEAVLGGEVALPAGDVPEPFVDADDIADVAVAALAEDGHAGQVYELTGPRPLTFADAVEEIATATGREIRYVPVSIDEYKAALAEHGVPAEFVSLLTYLFTEVLDGRNAHRPTVSGAPSAASPGTSASTRGTPRPRASGMPATGRERNGPPRTGVAEPGERRADHVPRDRRADRR